jgi:hypothetical protein
MTEATTTLVGGTERSGQPAAAARQASGRRLRLRHLWLVPGLGIAILANQLGAEHGVGILALIGFGVAPDVPRLFGSRAVRAHDLLHQPVGPVVAAAVSAAGVATSLLPVVWLVGSLVWLGHVIAGRGVGDAPRRRDPSRG